MRGYRNFHGLSGPAFGKAIKHNDLLVYPHLEELAEELDTLLCDGGIGIVTGEMGMGKTTAVRFFLETLEERACHMAYQGSSRHSAGVLQGLVEGLGVAPARHCSALLRQISQRVARSYAEERRKTMLVIDDAQLLEDSLLEDLRLLTNFELDAQEPLVLVLVGHPALRARLRLPVHLALWDRVRMHYRLEGLSLQETFDYIDCHLRSAGARAEIFTPEAKQALFDHAQGIPRRINTLALAALKKSARSKVSPIDAAFITQPSKD